MASARVAICSITILALFSVSSVSAETSTSPVIRQHLIGLTWDGDGFIASYGEAADYLLNVSLDGRTVTRFAPSFSGWNETYIAIGDGSAGFPAGEIYVSSNQSIYQISASGDRVSVFSTPQGVSRIGFLAFDRVGTWGRALFAVDDNGLLWSIAADGTAKVVQNFGKGVKPEGIAVAPPGYGKFGGYLFVSLELAKEVVAIAPNDTSRVFIAAKVAGEAPERIMSIPPNSDLFVAKLAEGTILRVPASTFSGLEGSLLMITEGDIEANGSISVLSAAGTHLNQERLYTEPNHPHFEAADFVPAGLSQAYPGASPEVSQGDGRLTTVPPQSLLAGALVAVVAAFAVSFAVRKRGEPRALFSDLRPHKT